MTYKIKRLILSGGALKGFAFYGSYTALMELKLLDELEVIAGNSVGSAVGLCLALKYTPDELYSFITSFEYDKVKQWDFINYLKNWGVEQGGRMESFAKVLISNKLNKPDATFEDLYEYNPIEFTVVATKLNTYESIFYNYKNTPKASVAKSIMKSVAIPLIITPVFEQETINGVNEKITYVDGAVRNNFPIDSYPDEPETVGLLLEQCHHGFRQINHLEEQISHTLGCLINAQTHEKIKRIKEAHVIHITVPREASFNISMTFEDRKMLYDLGYSITKTYFDDFLANYKPKASNKTKKKTERERLIKEFRQKLSSELIDDFDKLCAKLDH